MHPFNYFLCLAAVVGSSPSLPYFPGVTDTGIVMAFENPPCPGTCDSMGARDTWLLFDPNDQDAPYKFYYDGSGPGGWLSSLSVSNDPTLRTWTKKGTLLTLGPKGSMDSKSASYLTATLSPDKETWWGYYLATNQTSPPPYSVPIGPYYSMFATANSASGPWTQHRELGTVFKTGSPGPIMENPNNPGEWWQYCTGCSGGAIGLVSTTTPSEGGPWTEVMPLIIGDPVENWSMYFEESTQTWFGFTNHIGPDAQGMMFDDAIWVYWTQNYTSWPPSNKAVVLNRTNVIEPTFQVGRVGLPSVLRIPGNSSKLALLYDGGGTRNGVSYNEDCSVALAWLDLPLTPPSSTTTAQVAMVAPLPSPALPPFQLLMAYYSGVGGDTVGSGGLNALALAFFSPSALASAPSCSPPAFDCLQPAAGSGEKTLTWVSTTINTTLGGLSGNVDAGASPLYFISFGGATEGGQGWDTILSSQASAAAFGANAGALVVGLAALFPGVAFGVDLDIEGTATTLPHMGDLVKAFRAVAPYGTFPLQLCALSGLAIPSSTDYFKVAILASLGPAQKGFSHLNMMVDNQDEPCSFYQGLWNSTALSFLPLNSRVGGVWGEIYPTWVLHDPGCSELFPFMKEGGMGVGIWEWWVGESSEVAAVVAAVKQ